MENLQVRATFQIHEGKLEIFRGLASKCIESVKEKDVGTLQYDWFLSKDQSQCIVRETYVDSGALLSHVTNLGDLFGQLLEVSDFSVQLFGHPSTELLHAIATFDPQVYTPL